MKILQSLFEIAAGLVGIAAVITIVMVILIAMLFGQILFG